MRLIVLVLPPLAVLNRARRSSHAQSSMRSSSMRFTSLSPELPAARALTSSARRAAALAKHLERPAAPSVPRAHYLALDPGGQAELRRLDGGIPHSRSHPAS